MTSVYRRGIEYKVRSDKSLPVIYTRLFIAGNRNAYGKCVEILMYAAFFSSKLPRKLRRGLKPLGVEAKRMEAPHRRLTGLDRVIDKWHTDVDKQSDGLLGRELDARLAAAHLEFRLQVFTTARRCLQKRARIFVSESRL